LPPPPPLKEINSAALSFQCWPRFSVGAAKRADNPAAPAATTLSTLARGPPRHPATAAPPLLILLSSRLPLAPPPPSSTPLHDAAPRGRKPAASDPAPDSSGAPRPATGRGGRCGGEAADADAEDPAGGATTAALPALLDFFAAASAAAAAARALASRAKAVASALATPLACARVVAAAPVVPEGGMATEASGDRNEEGIAPLRPAPDS